VARATALFGGHSKVGPDMLALRPIVQAREKPRPLFVQPVLRLNATGGPPPIPSVADKQKKSRRLCVCVCMCVCVREREKESLLRKSC
jgi:hypothetical protein